jgi:hypothetical protein
MKKSEVKLPPSIMRNPQLTSRSAAIAYHAPKLIARSATFVAQRPMLVVRLFTGGTSLPEGFRFVHDALGTPTACALTAVVLLSSFTADSEQSSKMSLHQVARLAVKFVVNGFIANGLTPEFLKHFHQLESEPYWLVLLMVFLLLNLAEIALDGFFHGTGRNENVVKTRVEFDDRGYYEAPVLPAKDGLYTVTLGSSDPQITGWIEEHVGKRRVHEFGLGDSEVKLFTRRYRVVIDGTRRRDQGKKPHLLITYRAPKHMEAVHEPHPSPLE